MQVLAFRRGRGGYHRDSDRAGTTPPAASLPVLPDSCDISRQQRDGQIGGRLTDGSNRGRLARLIDSVQKSVTAPRRASSSEERRAKDVIYSPFRAPVFIGKSDTPAEGWGAGSGYDE